METEGAVKIKLKLGTAWYYPKSKRREWLLNEFHQTKAATRARKEITGVIRDGGNKQILKFAEGC